MARIIERSYYIRFSKRVIWLLFATITLSACFRSKTTELYILPFRNLQDAIESDSAPSDSKAIPCRSSLWIRDIRLPDYLGRSEIISVASDGRLIARDFQQWGEPLELGFSRILRAELRTQLPEMAACISLSPMKSPLAFELSITVSEFEHRIDEERCVLKASWILAGDGEAVVQPQFSGEVNSTGDAKPGEIAQCLRDLIASFAARVGKSLLR